MTNSTHTPAMKTEQMFTTPAPIIGPTPGPWFVGGSENTVRMWVNAQHGIRICTMTPRSNDADNARLIAAAPDLLAALEHALSVGEKLSDWMRDHTGPADGTIDILTDWHEMRERESAAIALARGG